MTRALPTCLLTTAMLLAATSGALAQTPAPLPIRLGQTVWVTTSEGLDMKGVVSAVTATTLDVSGEAGTRQVVVAETRRIAKRDGNRNGFLIGAAVGALPFLAEAAGGDSSGCEKGLTCHSTGWYLATSLLSGGLWGGIGALIDNSIEGRETIYTRPSPLLQVTPVVTRSGVGVRAAIRW